MTQAFCTACRHFAQFYTKKLTNRRSDREKVGSRARTRVELLHAAVVGPFFELAYTIAVYNFDDPLGR